MEVLNSQFSPIVMKVAPAVEEIFQRLVSGTKAIQGKQFKNRQYNTIAQICRIYTLVCRKIQGVQEEHAIALSRSGASPLSRDYPQQLAIVHRAM